MLNKTRAFYISYLRTEDIIILVLLLIATINGLIYILVNALTAQYTGNLFITWKFFIMLPIMIILYFLSIYSKEFSPYISFITWTYTMYFFMLVGLSVLTYGVQFTPFLTHDHFFLKIDQLLGFNQTAVLDWTHQHPILLSLLNKAYATINIELTFIPLILAFCLEKRRVKVLFMSLTLSFIIGTGLYYYLPTTAPASVFFDPYFAQEQKDTFIKFFEIHHHLPITTQEGGLIAFPSFHVIWCLLFAYAMKNKSLLFYPIALLNTLTIMSTILLGWHYLIDVLGGIIIASFAICLSEKIYKKYLLNNDTRQSASRRKIVNLLERKQIV